MSADGTLSADQQPVAQIGLVVPEDATEVSREAGVLFRVDGNVVPVEPGQAQILQGFVEESNVNPVAELARMIAVQRAYELGQRLLDQENDRISQTVQVLGTSA
jgi:flagellar basal-body rod protein FlgF